MKIKTALQLTILLLLAVFVFFGIILFFSFRQIEAARQRSALINHAVHAVNELKELTLEHLLFPGPRVTSQWHQQYVLLARLLDSIPMDTQEHEIHAEIVEDRNQMQQLFSRVSSLEEEDDASTEDVTQELKNRLSGQLVIRAQHIVGTVLRLQESSIEHLANAQKLAIATIAVFASFMLVVVIAIVHVFQKKIIRPVLVLEEGTRIIGRGNLRYRVPVESSDEIGALSRSFNDMTGKLAVIDKMKTDFLVVAAHQLRTPLGAIRWTAESLLEKTDTSADDVKKTVRDIHESVVRMITIVGELLSVTRIEQAMVTDHPEPIDVRELIEATVKEFDGEAVKRHADITLEIKESVPMVVTIDRNRLADVIRNVVSNALRFSREGGSVRVEADADGGVLELRVSDLGIGIPSADQPHVFTKFFRAYNAAHHDPDGSGLGLFITKSYVEDWGGTITFTSSEGTGTTFVIRIPIHTGPPA